MAMSAAAAGGALADANPAGAGQPATGGSLGQAAACGMPGRDTASPNGFNSPGFANASQRYAGSPLNPNASGNPRAVAEYDIACYQATQHALNH
jgi:hypothetical protein